MIFFYCYLRTDVSDITITAANYHVFFFRFVFDDLLRVGDELSWSFGCYLIFILTYILILCCIALSLGRIAAKVYGVEPQNIKC